MRRLLGSVGVVLLLLPAAAHGLPGDPPPEPLTPADGVRLATDPEGVAVTYTCPTYRDVDDGGGPFDVFGFSDDYTVIVATSAAVGADGRLATGIVATVPGPYGSESPCTSTLASPAATAGPFQTTPGTYWWQPTRACTGCANGVEVGAVRSFTLGGNAALKLAPQRTAFAGYPLYVPVTAAGLPAGTEVRIERAVGSGWKAVAPTTPFEGKAQPLVSLPRGTQRLPATVTVGTETTTSPVAVVRVVKAKRWSTGARDVGAYRDAARPSLRFTVDKAGRRVRGFRVDVPTSCVVGNGVEPGISTVTVPPVRIAPDGRFATQARLAGQSVEVSGRVRKRAARGLARIAAGACAGRVEYSARRR